MNYVRSTGLIFLFAFLAGCFGPPTGTGDGNDNNPRFSDPIERDYDARRERDREERTRVIRDSRQRRSGNVCEDEDRGHDCEDICRDIYSRRADREDCEELTVSQIEVLEELHELLENPDDDDLASVDSSDLEVYLKISIDPFDKLIGKYSSREAKEVMIWLIENDDITEIVRDEDDDFQALEELFENINSAGSTGDDIYKYFTAKLDGSDKVMEVAVESGGEEILDWFTEFINEENSDCSDDETSAKCFTIYCKIGDSMDDEYRDDWLGFENFEEYVDDIIQEGTNSPSSCGNKSCWGVDSPDSDDYEDIGDIDDWVEDLCEDGVTNLTN